MILFSPDKLSSSNSISGHHSALTQAPPSLIHVSQHALNTSKLYNTTQSAPGIRMSTGTPPGTGNSSHPYMHHSPARVSPPMTPGTLNRHLQSISMPALDQPGMATIPYHHPHQGALISQVPPPQVQGGPPMHIYLDSAAAVKSVVVNNPPVKMDKVIN